MKTVLLILLCVAVVMPMAYMAFRSADLLGALKLSEFVQVQGIIGYPSPIYVEHISQSTNDFFESLTAQWDHIIGVSLEQGTLIDGFISSAFAPIEFFVKWLFGWLS